MKGRCSQCRNYRKLYECGECYKGYCYSCLQRHYHRSFRFYYGLGLLILLSLLMLSPVFSDKIVLNSQKYFLSLEQDVIGYSPISGRVNIPHITALSKQGNLSLGMCIGFTTPLLQSSKSFVSYNEILNNQVDYFYRCNSSSYGWITQGKLAYCDMDYYDPVNDTTETSRDFVQVTSNYQLETHPSYAIITWSEDNITRKEVRSDVTSNIQVVHKPSPLGNFWYCLDRDFVQGRVYDFTYDVLPYNKEQNYKYSLVFMNTSTRDILLSIDPYITVSQSWSTTEDFSNNTEYKNISIANDEISISSTLLSGLISYLSFDSNFTDSHNGSYDATGAGGLVINSTGCLIGDCVNLDGVNDYVNWSSVPLSTKFSINCWYNTTSNDGILFARTSGVFAKPTQAIQNSDGNFQLFMGNGATHYSTTTTNYVMPQKRWAMYTFFVSDADNALDVYVNAIKNITDTNSQGVTDDTTISFLMGTRATLTQFYDGRIDECGIWNRNLTILEKQTLYNNGLGLTYPFITQGTFAVREGWFPRNNSKFTNMVVEVLNTTTSNIYFQYNSSNASLDTSALIRLDYNGTNNLSLNMDYNASIFFKFVLYDNAGSTPYITSFTLYEENTSIDITHSINDVYTIVLNTNTTLNSLMTEFQYFTIILLYLVLMIFSIWLIRIRSTFLGFGLFTLTILFDFWFIYWSSLVFLPNFTALDWQSYFNMIPMTFFPLWIFIKILAIMLSVSRFGVKKIF